MKQQLFPKAPRRMKQPRKDEIRRQLAVAEAEAIVASTPRWWRLWHRAWARLVEVDPAETLAGASHYPPERNPGPDIFRSKAA